jgi:transcription elongation factor Elf1
MDKKISNANLHDEALTIFKKMEPTKSEAKAKDVASDYNARRKAQTEALRPVLTEMQARFEKGETIGASASMKEWCATYKDHGAFTYARVRQILTGKSGNENKVKSLDQMVVLKPGTVFKVLIGEDNDGNDEYATYRIPLDILKSTNYIARPREFKYTEHDKRAGRPRYANVTLGGMEIVEPEKKEEQPAPKKKDILRHIQDGNSAVSLCGVWHNEKYLADERHPANCKKCLKIQAEQPEELYANTCLTCGNQQTSDNKTIVKLDANGTQNAGRLHCQNCGTKASVYNRKKFDDKPVGWQPKANSPEKWDALVRSSQKELKAYETLKAKLDKLSKRFLNEEISEDEWRAGVEMLDDENSGREVFRAHHGYYMNWMRGVRGRMEVEIAGRKAQEAQVTLVVQEKCPPNIAPEILEVIKRQQLRISVGAHPSNDGCPTDEEEVI